MRTSKQLFNLIKSLTPAEKRYFKILCSQNLNSKRKNFIKLFDAIAAQSKYDEEKLRERFVDAPFLKNLSGEKNYLFNHILKCMRQYHAERSPYNKVTGLTLDAYFLKQKGLFKESKKTIRKIRSLCKKHSLFLPLIDLSDADRWMTYEMESKSKPDQLDKISRARDEAMEALKAEHQISSLYDKMAQVRREYSLSPRKEFLQQLELIYDEIPDIQQTKGLSLKAQTYHNKILGIYHSHKGEREMALSYYKTIISAFYTF